MPAADLAKLHLYVARSVFPAVWQSCWRYALQDAASVQADEKLTAVQRRAQPLTPAQLDMDPEARLRYPGDLPRLISVQYFVEADDPFQEAVDILNELPYEVVRPEAAHHCSG